MGFFLRVILISVVVILIVRSIGSLLGTSNTKSKDFRKSKDELRKTPKSKDREYKGGDYIDYEDAD